MKPVSRKTFDNRGYLVARAPIGLFWRACQKRSLTWNASGAGGSGLVLDALHRLVVEAEVVPDLVDDDVADHLRHLVLIRTIFLDRPLVDVDRIGQDIAVARVPARQVDAAVEPIESVRRLDLHLRERRFVGPVLHDCLLYTSD